MSITDGIDPELLISPVAHPWLKRVSRPTVYRWLTSGRLRGVRTGRTWFTTKVWVDEFIAASTAPSNKPNPRSRLKSVEMAEAELAARRPVRA